MLVNKRNLKLFPLGPLALALLTSACGPQSSSVINPNTTSTVAAGSTSGDQWSGGTPTAEASTTPQNLATPIENSFIFMNQATACPSTATKQTSTELVYLGNYTVNGIMTDNMLQATVSLNAPMGLYCGSAKTSGVAYADTSVGASMNYSCAQISITPIFTSSNGSVVTGSTKQVKVSRGSPTAGPCKGISDKATADFGSFANQQGVKGNSGTFSIKYSSVLIDNAASFYGCATWDANNFMTAYQQDPGYSGYSASYCPRNYISSGYGTAFAGFNTLKLNPNVMVSINSSIQTNTP